ncbi:MAG: hypothetical protein A7315_10270 [Candidatus Altiarchaeales archaeon WOR_SM1_79]|nr:MAG: hypothetical protein A7315_10270 [Candidatus Altiarchaeales archaeon WOR_SM1_79]
MVTTTIIASGIQAGVGCALDHITNHLYFVEYTAGTLRRISWDPIAGTYTLDPTPIATGFTHPEDVELDLVNNLAYVTTRDDLGTTGALWKVEISTGTKTMVTFNLGAPQQLVLDLANNCAYTVGYDDGRLRRIDLTTGAKTPLCTVLDHPVGIAVTNDKNFAYVTEQGASNCITEVDLTTGVKTKVDVMEENPTPPPDIIPATFTAPFFLAWTDDTQNSLFVVERDPANKVSRVDLTAVPVRYDVVTGLPFRPSGVALHGAGTSIYVTTDTEIVKVDLVDFDLTSPVFLGVGHVPYGKIGRDDSKPDEYGYASTDPGYFFYVTRAPFGGTLNFFGNLTNFKDMGAAYYAVWVSKDGGAYSPLSLAWNTYKWNNVTLTHDLVPVAPALDGTKYEIPTDASIYDPALWYPPFLFMRWPSGENGIYQFKVKLYDADGTTEILGLPSDLNNLVLRVDNNPPTAEILKILQNSNEIPACGIVSSCPDEFKFKITAHDAEGHLRSYGLYALTGNNETYPVGSDSHAHDTSPWYGVINHTLPPSGSWSPVNRNCAHTFWLGVWSKTINGYNHIRYRRHHKSITIDLPPTCP